MDQQNIPTSLSPEVVIEKVAGSLQVKGWERPEVAIKASANNLNVEEQDDTVHIQSGSACNVRLPHGASLQVEQVGGEARFKLLEDQLEIEEVTGSLELRNVGDTHVERIHGNLEARQIQGDLHIGHLSGNAEVRNVQGDCRLDEISGNLELRNVEGEVKASASGNINLRLGLLQSGVNEIASNGSVHCRLAKDSSVTLNLSSSAQNINLKLPGDTRNIRSGEHSLTIGLGEAILNIRANGSISITAQEADWEEGEDGSYTAGSSGFSAGFGEQIYHQINSQIQEQMESIARQMNDQMSNLSSMFNRTGVSPEMAERIIQQARESSERATAKAQERMRRAQEKLERKMETERRRSEMRANASRGRRSWNVADMHQASPAQPVDSVSDEERLLILKMLEQKKITIEEAEKLLAALEDKNT